MTFSAVAASAGRLFIGALRYIGGGISAFAKGAVANAKIGNTEEEQRVAAAIRVKEMITRNFGNFPWYLLLLLSILCLGVGLFTSTIEIQNLRALLESTSLQTSSAKVFGVSPEFATAIVLMIAENVFGFLLFAAQYSIPFGLRSLMSVATWSISIIIIFGNYTSLEKRDIMAKRAAENQRQVAELTKRSQDLAGRAMAAAETAVKATEKNGATSATRAGAVAAANAADVAKEQAIMTRQVAAQLSKAPPPASSDVQGDFVSKVMKWASAIVMFAIQAISMRLSGLFALMSRHEYVAGRKEVNAAPNLKTSNVAQRGKLPDPAPAPAPLPRVDARKLADMLASEPAPAPPTPPVPMPSARITQAGRLGTEKPRAPSPAPEPQPAPATQPEPGRNQPEPVPEPDFELPEPDRSAEPTYAEPSGRVVIGQPVLADKRTEPVLRALLLSDITEVSYGTANAALKETGVKPTGMGKPAMLACLAHLESCGLLERTPAGHRTPTSALLTARKMVSRPGSNSPMTASLDDVVSVMVKS